MTIGHAVRLVRCARRMSQLELAMAAETTQDRISAIEAGGDVRVGTLQRIATALGVELRVGEYCLNTIDAPRLMA